MVEFAINEAWILFKLNDAPIITKQDEEFNVVALMDAATTFMLATEFTSIHSEQLSPKALNNFIAQAYSHKQQYPKKILVTLESIEMVFR